MEKRRKIDEAQVRRFYQFLPWAGEMNTLVQLKLPVKDMQGRFHNLRALARNEEEFVDLVLRRPIEPLVWVKPGKADYRQRDIYVGVNPIRGNLRDYFPTDTRHHGTNWPDYPPARDINSERLACRRIIALDLDRTERGAVEPKDAARAIVRALRLDSYLIVRSGRGCHLWVPVLAQPWMKWSGRQIKAFLDSRLDFGNSEVKVDVRAAFSILRVPGTFHTKNPKRPLPVRILSEKCGDGPPNEDLVQKLNVFMEDSEVPVWASVEEVEGSPPQDTCGDRGTLSWSKRRAQECPFISYFESGKWQDMDSWLDLARGLVLFKDGKRHFRRLSERSPKQYDRKKFESAWRWAENTRYPPLCEDLRWDPDGGEWKDSCPRITTCPVRSFPYLVGLPRNARKPAVSCRVRDVEVEEDTVGGAVRWLKDTLGCILKDNDGKIHLVQCPAGVGKTREALALQEKQRRPSVYLAPTHDLMQEQLDKQTKRMRKKGRRTRCEKTLRFDESACPEHFEEAKHARDNGWNLAATICRRLKCSRYREDTCPWWQGKDKARGHRVLMAASAEINVGSFWTNFCENRNLVVIDESALGYLRKEVTIPDEHLQDLLTALTEIREQGRGEPSRRGFAQLRRLLNRVLHPEELARKVAEIHRESGEHPSEVLPPLMQGHAPESLTDEHIFVPSRWSHALESSLRKALGKTSVDNRVIEDLLVSLRDLTSFYRRADEKTAIVPVIKEWKLWVNNPLPDDKTIILLDATTDEHILRENFGDRLEVHRFEPSIRPKSRIVQIMDSLWSGHQLRSAVKDDGFSAPLREHLLGILDHLTQVRHKKTKRIGLISHKREENLVKKLKKLMRAANKRIKTGYFGNLCGLNEFEDCDLLIVVGSPLLKPDQIPLTTNAFTGDPKDFKRVRGKTWRRITDPLTGMTWQIHGYYPDHRHPAQQAVYASLVTGELVQAVGRSRYLTSGMPVVVLTCEPLPIPGIERMYWKDFNGEIPSTRNATNRSIAQGVRQAQKREPYYSQLKTEVVRLLKKGEKVTPNLVATHTAFDGKTLTKKGYWNRIKKDMKAKFGSRLKSIGKHGIRLKEA